MLQGLGRVLKVGTLLVSTLEPVPRRYEVVRVKEHALASQGSMKSNLKVAEAAQAWECFEPHS